MTTAIERARDAGERARWAHVSLAWCDYGCPIPKDLPYPYGRGDTGGADHETRRRRGSAIVALSIAGLAVLAGALGAL
jgi:hypothetical protein